EDSGMPFDPLLDPDAARRPIRAILSAAAALALFAAPALGEAPSPGLDKSTGDKNITEQVQKETSVALPSLSPLVQRVLPAVVNISAQLSGDAAAQPDQLSDDRDQPGSPFEGLMRRYFEHRGMPQQGHEATALGSGF